MEVTSIKSIILMMLMSVFLLNCSDRPMNVKSKSKSSEAEQNEASNSDENGQSNSNGSNNGNNSNSGSSGGINQGNNLINFLRADNIFVVEGESAQLTVERLSYFSQTLNIVYSVRPNQIGASEAFASPQSGVMTLSSGYAKVSISISAKDNDLEEANRTFIVDFYEESQPNKKFSANVIILDDEGMPNMSFSNAVVTEGDTALVYVSLSSASDFDVSVDWDIVEINSVNGVDYSSASSGKVNFAPGEIEKTISIQTMDNSTANGTRQFNIQFSNPKNVALANSVAYVKIQDDENTSISAGNLHTCAAVNGQLKCWGYNGYGQLGEGTTTTRKTPQQVSGMEAGVSAVAAGNNHTCSIQNGALFCWGYNAQGQLGIGDYSTRQGPQPVIGLSNNVLAVAIGSNFSCAISAVDNGQLKCWGQNNYGQLGDGFTTNRSAPIIVPGAERNVSAVAAGDSHVCAIVDKGLFCWGYNGYGQLGDGTTARSGVIRHVSGLEENVTKVSVAYNHSCAVHDGYLKCWGHNNYGQLGDDSTTNISAPYIIENSGTEFISKTNYSTCRSKAGVLECWGYNGYGQLGTGNTTSTRLFQTVANVSSIVAISSGQAHHRCVVESDSQVKCWGRNDYGQIGNGTGGSVTTPVAINF